MDRELESAGGSSLQRLSERAPFVWRWSKMEDGRPAEWRQIAHCLIAPPINQAASHPLEKSGKHRDAESFLSCSLTICSMI
jgi:hypothetical protein